MVQFLIPHFLPPLSLRVHSRNQECTHQHSLSSKELMDIVKVALPWLGKWFILMFGLLVEGSSNSPLSIRFRSHTFNRYIH